ncbi:MAG: 23S rRNA (uracil(1939)-C(5))-methyltransferase RlmD [Marinilabiliales bacterium]
MSRKKKKPNPVIENIEIIDIASEGKALAKYNDIVVFVKNAVPGDICDLQVTKKKKNYMEAYPVKFHKYSTIRIKPECSHFEICGGCTWQQLPYDKQLFYKHKQINEQFSHIGKFDYPEIKAVLPSEKQFFYRNKLEYTFSNKRWLTKDEINTEHTIKDLNALGFHIPGKFDKILDIEKCYLQEEPSNKIRNEIKKFAIANDFDFYDIKNKTGLLRNLIIRNTTTKELMVIVVFGRKDEDKQNKLLSFIADTFPQITSLQYTINTKLNETLYDLEIITYKGYPFITEKLGDMVFRVNPKSFYQTNSLQAEKLYKKILEFASPTAEDLVYDLYTGTGTIANFIAPHCKFVVGIDSVPEAIEDAYINSENNNNKNLSFYAGDMKELLNSDFFDKNGYPDIIITDPPRAGMHPKVVENILNSGAKKIIYVSCNPATQARDLSVLSLKYKILDIQPVDMFPQTTHIENIVKLEKISL